MKHILTLSLCFLALSLSAQENCLLINEGINDFVVMGTFDSHQYYISENPVPISDGFYEDYNDLASLYGGNLLTIGSSEEDEYVYSAFFSGGFSNLSSYYYIGLYNTNPSHLCCGQGNPPGVWEWINGESVEYTNWDINANQPSGNELYASGGGSWGGVWADVSGGHQGYIIIEVEQCPVSVSGCLDSYACNFNDSATEDDGSCDYSCCPGPGCCNIGMTWNWELGICETSMPTDTNLDGCTDLNDLMDLLSAYGYCAVVESEFICGDPLGYQGYDYETVLIDEQCWFAENARYLPAISSPNDGSEQDGMPHGYVYDYLGDNVEEAQEHPNYQEYGGLYNLQAVLEWELCPTGWHVPNTQDWHILFNEYGGISIAGPPLMSTYGWDDDGNGTNLSGFNGKPAGDRNVPNVTFYSQGRYGFFWTTDLEAAGAACFILRSQGEGEAIGEMIYPADFGISVRCIKD